MALELGIDRKQIESLQALYRRWTGDPVQFRFLATLVLMAIIIVVVEMPFAARLDAARARKKQALAMSTLAHDVRGFAEQVEAYDPKVAVSPELVNWQNYVLTLLAPSSATLISLEPKAVEAKGVFQVVQMELVARGSSFREFVEFIDRVEHGERLMRVEKVRLEKHQTAMYLTCMIRGLVKSSAAADGKDKGSSAGDSAGDAAEGAANAGTSAHAAPGPDADEGADESGGANEGADDADAAPAADDDGSAAR